LDILAGVADLLTMSQEAYTSGMTAMDVDDTDGPNRLGRMSPATLARANKPAHLQLSPTLNPSTKRPRDAIDALLPNRGSQPLSRFGAGQPQTVQGRKMLILGPRRDGSEGQEEANAHRSYVLDSGSSRGSSLPPPNVPRTMPAIQQHPDSSNSSASGGDQTLSHQASSASMASIDAEPAQLKRPRSRTVNLPSISQLFPGEDGRAPKIARMNMLLDQAQHQHQARSANRPRSLSDVVVSHGRSGPPLPNFQQPIKQPAMHRTQASSYTTHPQQSQAHSQQGSQAQPQPAQQKPVAEKARPPPIQPKLPVSHAHNSATKRFRCPLYSCSGKLTPHQSKVKAAVLKCDGCERVYWQVRVGHCRRIVV
jgi:hypothetical protein